MIGRTTSFIKCTVSFSEREALGTVRLRERYEANGAASLVQRDESGWSSAG